MELPNNNHPEGKCLFMCPVKERNLRERENLLHKYEIKKEFYFQNQQQQQQYGKGNSRKTGLPKADIEKVVKSFARSAAGQEKTCPEDLRPPNILKKTVQYLLKEVLTQENEPYNVIYDFVFDRLRSVRQDLIIQRINDLTAIQILESVVNFHLYSSYRLKDEPISIYDPKINEKHLLDCLSRLIYLYEINEFWGSSRITYESLNLISNINSYSLLSRAFALRRIINSSTFDMSIQLCLAAQSGNYVKYFKLIDKLPILLASYMNNHSRIMRSSAYKSIAKSYGIKNCKFPLENLIIILSYPNDPSGTHQATQDSKFFSSEILEIDGKKYVNFEKSLCNLDKAENLSWKMGGKSAWTLLSPNMIEYAGNNLICTF